MEEKIRKFLNAPGRENIEVINQQKAELKNEKYLKVLYNAIADIVLILNKERQVVFYNDVLLKTLGVDKDVSLHGLRPGEVMDCINAYQSKGGCGTAEFCKTCGALHSIQNSQKNDTQDTKECRIIQRNTNEAFDMEVTSTPIKINGQPYTIFALKDISHEKRRQILERIFFHDILNTAGGIRAVAELINDATDEDMDLFREILNSSSEKLVDEIFSQRDITDAENNSLQVKYEEINSNDFLHKMRDVYLMHDVSKGKDLEIADNSETIKFGSDKALLSRILGNLIKNALEASQEDEKVIISSNIKKDNIVFLIKNRTYIPKDVQLQLFNRSFSTKGRNRGLGTYSIKLFTEKFLNGHVAFSSTSEHGTIFRVVFPIRQKES